MRNIIIFTAINGPAQTPTSNESGDVPMIPGICDSDDKMMAGNTTETKLINTIPIENKNTIHGMILFVPVSVFLSFFCFIKRDFSSHAFIKFELFR